MPFFLLLQCTRPFNCYYAAFECPFYFTFKIFKTHFEWVYDSINIFKFNFWTVLVLTPTHDDRTNLPIDQQNPIWKSDFHSLSQKIKFNSDMIELYLDDVIVSFVDKITPFRKRNIQTQMRSRPSYWHLFADDFESEKINNSCDIFE